MNTETICAVGCLMSSISMSLAYYNISISGMGTLLSSPLNHLAHYSFLSCSVYARYVQHVAEEQ